MWSLADPLEHARRQYADRVAVIDGGVTMQYGRLASRSARVAAGLQRLGARPGDRVAVLASNGHRFFEVFFGVPAHGMVVVPLNTRLAEPELRAILVDSGAQILLSDRPVGALAEHVRHVVSMPDQYERLLETSGEPSASAPVDENATAALFYTGGTTGAAKGVMLTHRNLLSNALHKIVACSLTGQDRFLAVAPMFHVAGVAPLVGLMWLGACAVTLPAFDPEVCLSAIERHRITVAMPVPTMLAAMAEAQQRSPRDVSSLRLLGHAGSPIADATVVRAHQAFPHAELAQFYGATETSSIVTCLRHEQQTIGTPLLGSCGRTTPGVAVKIARDDGTECASGEIGEILVRGPNVAAGYYGNSEATAAAFVDGWYRTGDLGLSRDDGHLFVVDRKKDMIVSGAENVYSIEVEDALHRHPAVAEAAVFGVPDAKWGEAVHAIVVVREASHAEDSGLIDELKAHCRAFIAGFKVPKTIELWKTPLPKSGPGKVLKRVLRERYWNATNRGEIR